MFHVTPIDIRACSILVRAGRVMNLESKWLEDFSALAATRSFSQAAGGVSSPSRPSAGASAALKRRWA
jgi:hypothetical protein